MVFLNVRLPLYPPSPEKPRKCSMIISAAEQAPCQRLRLHHFESGHLEGLSWLRVDL